MKIILTHLNLTTESGDPKMILSIAQSLKKKGHEVVVFCSEFNPRSCFPRFNQGLDVRIVAPKKPLSSVLGAVGLVGKILERVRKISLHNNAAKRIANQIKLEKDIDFIICENDYTYKSGAIYKKKNPKAKVVWIMNNPPFFHSKKKNIFFSILSRVINLFEWFSAKIASSKIDWIVVYDENFHHLVKSLGTPVKILRNPVDVGYFLKTPKEPQPKIKIQLLSLGALSPNRRFEDTISAASILRSKGYKASVVIICKDYWGDKLYRKNFENFIKSLDAENYVKALFEGASEDEYLKLIHSSDVFVLPNNVKNWAVGAFEAMAAGLPLIVSRATAVADVLIDGENALFVDSLQPEQIAQKIEILINKPALYKKIALQGQEFVKEEMGLDKFINEILISP